MMKVYFDESGQTGCILPNKNGDLYNDKQRFFVLGGIICKTEEEETTLRDKYKAFLDKYGITGEFKGAEMMKKENNAILFDFINSMIDSEHFYICCYDKLFYLATIINSYFFTRQLMNDDPIFYYTQANALTHENPELFIKYCECNKIGTEEASMDFCRYVVDFPFQKIDPELNGYREMAKLAIQHGEAFDFPLPFGCYLNEDYTHIVNMTAVGETIVCLKQIYNLSNKDLHIVHDRIKEFEPEFLDSFQAYSFDFRFGDSKDDLLLQYADNIASIFRKCCTETVFLFESGKQWDKTKWWHPKLYAKLLQKLTYKQIKWDVSIADQVLPLCVAEMFSDSFPVEKRNNNTFYQYFFDYKNSVLNNIISLDYDVDLG